MRRKNKLFLLVLFAVIVLTLLQFRFFDKKWHVFEQKKKTEQLLSKHALLRDSLVDAFGNDLHFIRSNDKQRQAESAEMDVDDKWLQITQSFWKKHRPEFVKEIENLENANLRLAVNSSLPPWFSEKDILRLQMMSDNSILGLKPLPYRVKISRVVYDTGIQYPKPFNASKVKCREQCAVVKTIHDTYEVFAFHLDRVLGLNRTLPMVARSLFPEFPENPNVTLHDGKVRPVVWFEPNILHGGSYQKDQNTIDVTWPGYLRILKARCWDRDNYIGDDTICNFPIRLIEWSKLALLDFLIQNYDRLDRNCCGYHNVSQGESCFRKQFHLECDGDPENLMLVHILTLSTDTSRLVFIDNAGNPKRSIDALNYKLLAGIEELPEHSVAIIKSGFLRSMLRRSLYSDNIFWNKMTDEGIDAMIETIEKRTEKLLTFIEEQNIKLVPDY